MNKEKYEKFNLWNLRIMISLVSTTALIIGTPIYFILHKMSDSFAYWLCAISILGNLCVMYNRMQPFKVIYCIFLPSLVLVCIFAAVYIIAPQSSLDEVSTVMSIIALIMAYIAVVKMIKRLFFSGREEIAGM